MDEIDTSQNTSNDDAESNDEHVSCGTFSIYLRSSAYMLPKLSSPLYNNKNYDKKKVHRIFFLSLFSVRTVTFGFQYAIVQRILCIPN